MSVWQSKTSKLSETSTKLTLSADASAATQQERQRGLWNFLTWSFVLANFLTATDVAGGAARATSLASDPHDASHGNDSSSPFHASDPGIQSAILESSHASPQLPESASRLATNLINPPGQSMSGTAPLSLEIGSHASPMSSGTSVGAFNNDEATSQDGHTGPDANTGGNPELGLTTVVDHAVDIVTHTVGDVVGGAVHTIGDVVTTLDDTIDTTLHAITSTVAATGSLVTNLLDPVETATGLVDHATAEAVTGPTDILHATMLDLGLSSSGSLTFAAETINDAVADISAPLGGYSQYNISVQDAATPDVPSVPSDTGSITTIVSSALGIAAHHTSSDASSADHSGDHQSPHILPVHDLTNDIHHALFA